MNRTPCTAFYPDHQETFDLQAGPHSTARRLSPAWSEQLLASDSKKSLKHSEAHASSLTGSLRSLYGTNQPESNTDHIEDLQVITYNDYSEKELASKPSSLSSSLNHSPSLFLSLPGAFKQQRVSEDCFPPVVSH